MGPKMQQATKMTEESLKTRRERNRQAQREFRVRRQATLDSQRNRIQHLENTIEELSNVLIDFCDEMLKTEQLAKHPNLIVRLQRSTTQALTLAKSVSNTSQNNGAEEQTDSAVGKRHDQKRAEKPPSKRTKRKADNPVPPQASSPERPLFVTGMNPDTDTSPSIDTGTGSSSDTGMWRDITPISPLFKQPWLQTDPIALDMNPFAVRLLEATWSLGCQCLSGELYVPREAMERAFGSALRLRTREQLLAHFQWLLSPRGRNDMYQAMGINWSPAAGGRGVKDSFHSFPIESSNHEPSDTDSSSDNGQVGQPEFLTAVAVQQQLESLGAKVLDPDTIELRIIGPRNGVEKSISSFMASPNLGLVAPARLTVRLNTTLLANSLAYVAKCLDRGPVYPSHEIAGAVEASVILVRNEGSIEWP
ncbi:hypothetical protein FALBO_12503 [Fusarium albosuccineum]|uniref:BZIP domain-containing protein n=1 Tax=Fusarium albosuccineum TaxID=1237068 RepID=A0A8H4P919_9HYPO|nr:hypothetical protein FALBO_12503 [Fusarium albosuccineum]